MSRLTVFAGLTGLVAVTLAPPAAAQAAVRGCGVNGDVQECAERLQANTDAALNTAYAQTLKRLETEALTAEERKDAIDGLRAAQRAWIAFRDADCDGAVGWGLNRRMDRIIAQAQCVAELSTARAEELRRRYLQP